MKYPYIVYIAAVENHTFWVAKCPELKGCVGQGETQEEAVAELENNEAEWIATAEECGIEIPEVPIVQEALPSGKFTVRVSPAVHQSATRCASKQGISLNQYVNDAIVSYNAQSVTLNAIKEDIKNIVLQAIPSTQWTISTGMNDQLVMRQEPLYSHALPN